MSTKYEKIYAGQKHALGPPTQEFVSFFTDHADQRWRVLDVGCGQGRDALFIARQGHHVVGVDLSESGVRDLLEDAARERLRIEAFAADNRHYTPTGRFDVIVVDRTLYMIPAGERDDVLASLLRFVAAGGYVLIADEKSNIPGFKQVLADSQGRWDIELEKRGFLFVHRAA